MAFNKTWSNILGILPHQVYCIFSYLDRNYSKIDLCTYFSWNLACFMVLIKCQHIKIKRNILFLAVVCFIQPENYMTAQSHYAAWPIRVLNATRK